MVNVPARRVIGVGRSARLPVLHATAGILSARNLYAQHCADMVGHTLRAEGSSVQTRVMGLMCQAYQLQSWGLPAQVRVPGSPLPSRVYCRRFFDMDLWELWFCDVLEHGPDLESRLKAGSVFTRELRRLRPDRTLRNSPMTSETFTSGWTWGCRCFMRRAGAPIALEVTF